MELLKIVTVSFLVTILAISSLSFTNIQTQAQAQQDPVSIENQIKHLQIKLNAITHQQELARKNTLSTAGFVKPALPTIQYDSLKNCATNQTEPAINSSAFLNHWQTYLTNFNCGHVVQTFANNHTALREFTLTARDNHGLGIPVAITLNKSDPVTFPSWSFNHTVPGPTMRMTAGDHVRITVYNSNESKWSHSMHMHSIHSAANDGMTGPGGSIPPGGHFVYEFIAAPFGLYPYHCHMEDVKTHIGRGLYGVFIIDPPTPRAAAKELVFLMNGYSFNQVNLEHPTAQLEPLMAPPTAQALREATSSFGQPEAAADDNNNNWNNDNNNNAGSPLPSILPTEEQQQQQPAGADNNNDQAKKDEALNPGGGEEAADNQFYTVNGMAFGYTLDKMIPLHTKQLYRAYVANLVEFDPVNSFHLHGTVFAYYPSATSMKPDEVNDIITLQQGDRGMMEFIYNLSGVYMIHSHINRFSQLGWTGFLNVAAAK